MARNPSLLVNLSWEGAETVNAAREALGRACVVEIVLPANMHYAVFRHLHADAPPGNPDSVDVEGGAEIVERLATVSGLENLEALTHVVRQARYRARVVSPSPLLTLSPPPAKKKGASSARKAAAR